MNKPNKVKVVLFRLAPEVKKKFEHYCIEHDTSMQRVIEEYIKKLISSS